MKYIPFQCCNQEWRYMPAHDKTVAPPNDKRLILLHNCPRLWISRINLDLYFVKRATVLMQLITVLNAVRVFPAKVDYAKRKEVEELAANAFPA